MACSVSCFSHFEPIETIHQFVELIDPLRGKKITKIQKKSSQLDITNEKDMGFWILQHVTNQGNTYHEHFEIILYMCLENWINHASNQKKKILFKYIASQSAIIRYQGVKPRTETIVVADYHMRTESCHLSLIFFHNSKCAQSIIKHA